MKIVTNYEEYEELYYLGNFSEEIILKIINEYKDSIKETSCLGRFVTPCKARIRVPMWDNEIKPGYDNIRKGFCIIEIGVGPDHPVAFHGFQCEDMFNKWEKIDKNA